MVESREWSYAGTQGTLVARTWSEPGPGGDAKPSHVVLLSHGYGEHIGRYEHVADALATHGAVVYGVDHLGHGKSDGERVVVSDFEDVVTDLHALDDTARAEWPGLPVVLVGHSMGGLIAARYAQRYGDTLAALVLSGPVIGDWQAAKALLAMDEIPDVPLDIGTLSRDPSVGERYAADPLVWHGAFKRPTLEAFDQAVTAVGTGPATCRRCGCTARTTSSCRSRAPGRASSTCAAATSPSAATPARGMRSSTRQTPTTSWLT